MPSPFPGMDPYLEDHALWPDVHHKLMTAISDSLAPILAPHYVVRVEERVFLCREDDPARSVLVPDLSVREAAPEPWGQSSTSDAAQAVLVQVIAEEEMREYRLEIRTPRGDRVVTVIEVLSPANKVSASEVRRTYMDKRREWLRSESNFIEIDLLRAGTRAHIPGGPPKSDYCVLVSTVDERPLGKCWYVGLRHALPTIPIPLGRDEPAVPLDLQAILSDAYARSRYDLELDYREPPPPPKLASEDVQWLDTLLREKGLRQ